MCVCLCVCVYKHETRVIIHYKKKQEKENKKKVSLDILPIFDKKIQPPGTKTSVHLAAQSKETYSNRFIKLNL